MRRSRHGGFTIVEMLLIIAIIGILATIVMMTVNPPKQIKKAENVRHVSGQQAVRDAVEQYYLDTDANPNDAQLPTGFGQAMPICAAGVTADPTCVNMDLLAPTYIAAIPRDPTEPNPNYSGFKIYKKDGMAYVLSTYAAGFIMTTGLIGYWPFDVASGTGTLDASDNNRTVFYENNPLLSQDLPPTLFPNVYSLKTNGNTSYAWMPEFCCFGGDDVDLRPSKVTLSLWMKTSMSGEASLASKGNWTTYGLFWIDGSIRPVVRLIPDNAVYPLNPNPVAPGKWHHVAMTYDQAVLKLYVDGHLHVSHAAPGTLEYGGLWPPLTIGTYFDDGAPECCTLNGNIDDVRVYNRALSEMEVQMIATGEH